MSVHVLQIQVGVLEHEEPRMRVANSSRDWPPEIRRLIERELDRWRERNPTRVTIGPTHSWAIERQCVVEFQHVDKSELPPAGTSSGEPPTPPPPGDLFAAASAQSQCARCGE